MKTAVRKLTSLVCMIEIVPFCSHLQQAAFPVKLLHYLIAVYLQVLGCRALGVCVHSLWLTKCSIYMYLYNLSAVEVFVICVTVMFVG